MKVAVTGNIGSGKTLFSRVFSRDKIPVIDADREGKQLLSEYRVDVFNMLNLRLTEHYVDTLKDCILNDRESFELYNNWVYEHLPRIIEEKTEHCGNVIVDCALVFEWGIEDVFDRIILIDGGDLDRRKARKADMNTPIIELLDSYQLPIEEKMKKSDIIVKNNGSKEDLIEKANEFHDKLFSDNINIDSKQL